MRSYFKKLKNGEIDKIYLCDNYILTCNDYFQIMISRGGKKRYFLSDKFLNRYVLLNDTEELRNTQEAIELLNDLLNNSRIGLKTREKLEKVKKLIVDSL